MRDLRSTTDAALVSGLKSNDSRPTNTHTDAPNPDGPQGITRIALITAFVLLIGSCLTWYSAGPLGAIMVVLITAILNAGKGRNQFLWTFRDWGIVVLFFVFYTLSRGIADTLGFPIQEQLLIDVDRFIGFGEQPVHRVQRLIDWDSPPSWWEVTFPIMYSSHFVAAMVPMAVLYRLNRPRAVAFLKRWVLLTGLGLIGYVLFPTVPPWMSADFGNIDTVYSGLLRGWAVLGSDTAVDVFERGADATNAIAAMPSLHAASAALIFLFFGLGSRRRLVQVLLGAYAAYMAFVIVITGMHWVIDVFAGWACALFAHWAISVQERRKLSNTQADDMADLATP